VQTAAGAGRAGGGAIVPTTLSGSGEDPMVGRSDGGGGGGYGFGD
jgi:hypothetical protein